MTRNKPEKPWRSVSSSREATEASGRIVAGRVKEVTLRKVLVLGLECGHRVKRPHSHVSPARVRCDRCAPIEGRP